MGRRLEAPPLRLGIQGAARQPRRGVQPAPAVRAGAGEPAAADRVRAPRPCRRCPRDGSRSCRRAPERRSDPPQLRARRVESAVETAGRRAAAGVRPRLNATAHDAHAGIMGESDLMLDTHAVARSLTAADFTPAQADALSGWASSRAITSRPTSLRPAWPRCAPKSRRYALSQHH